MFLGITNMLEFKSLGKLFWGLNIADNPPYKLTREKYTTVHLSKASNLHFCFLVIPLKYRKELNKFMQYILIFHLAWRHLHKLVKAVFMMRSEISEMKGISELNLEM